MAIPSKGKKSFIIISNGIYDSVKELEGLIPKRFHESSLDNKYTLSYDKVTNTSLLINSDPNMTLSFSKDIAYIFGLEPNEKATYPRGRYGNGTPPDISYDLKPLYIYSNIVNNRMVF